jgi:phage pi2 protein 07
MVEIEITKEIDILTLHDLVAEDKDEYLRLQQYILEGLRVDDIRILNQFLSKQVKKELLKKLQEEIK